MSGRDHAGREHDVQAHERLGDTEQELSRGRRRLLLLAAASLVAMGCNEVLGIDSGEPLEIEPGEPVETDQGPCSGAEPCSFTWRSGVEDGYATDNGVESPEPSDPLKQWISSWYPQNPDIASYDQTDVPSGQVWAHTFEGIAPPSDRTVCEGALTLRMRAYQTEELMQMNDGLGLPFIDANGKAMGGTFYRYISQIGVPTGADYTLVLDLANLPSVSGAMNVLPTIESLGYLDVYVQDDTFVDFSELTLQYCVKPASSP